MTHDDDDGGRTRDDGPLAAEQPGRYRTPEGGARVIGQGALGRVLVVWDAELEREVARKELLRPEGSPAAQRFLREARVTAVLEHPGVVPVHDMGRTAQGTLYYTMKWVRGQTLTEAIAGASSAAERLELLPAFVDLCQCVAYAHSKGVVHRDLKPDNVMVGAFGETVVIDWGLARVQALAEPAAGGEQSEDAGLTRVGAVLGTPCYMAPEQARGEPADERSDVWSLGMILFEIATGRRLFQGTSGDVLAHVRDARRAELPDAVAPELASVIRRCLRPQAADRYPSAAAVAEEVQDWLGGARVGAHEYSTTEVLGRLARQYRTGLTAAALAMALLAVGGGLAGWRVLVERDAARAAEVEAMVQRNEARAAYSASLTRAAVGALEQRQGSLALALAGTAVQVHDSPAARGALIGALSDGVPHLTWTADSDGCWTLREAPDGAAVGCTRPGEVVIWEADGAVRHTLGFEGPPTHGFAWSADGLVASGRAPHTVVWDAATGVELARLDTSDSGSWALAFVDDGRLALGQMDGRIRLWNPRTGREDPSLVGHSGRVNQLAPSGDRLAVGAADGTTAIWSLRTGERMVLPAPAEGASAVAWSPDGTLLASAGGRSDAAPAVHLWDGAQGTLAGQIPLGGVQPSSLWFDPGGELLAVGTRASQVRLFRVADRRLVHELTLPDEHNIKSVVSGAGGLLAIGDWGRPRRWVLPALGVGGAGPQPASSRGLCWLDDGSVAAMGKDGVLRWFRPSGAVDGLQLLSKGGAAHCAGGRMRVGTEGGIVELDALTGRELGRSVLEDGDSVMHFSMPEGESQALQSVRVRGGGGAWTSPALGEDIWSLAELGPELAVAVRKTGELVFFDGQSGRELRRVARDQHATELVPRPDGKALAVGTLHGGVELLTLPGLEPVWAAQDASSIVAVLGWSPDGRRLVSGHNDGRVMLRDARGTLLADLPHPRSAVLSVAIGVGGAAVATSTADRQVFRWQIDSVDLDADAVARLILERSGLEIAGGQAQFRVRSELPEEPPPP